MMRERVLSNTVVALTVVLAGSIQTSTTWGQSRAAPPRGGGLKVPGGHREDPVKPPSPRVWPIAGRDTSPARIWVSGAFQSVQVNVDSTARNVVGDAASEPSIAVDPTNPSRMAIGWRQFDTIASDFRQSGVAYSNDGGQTWHSPIPNVLQPNEFSSDPVLASDEQGRFYYYALQPDRGPGEWACYMYRSEDGGITWPDVNYAFGGDKAWFAIDLTGGVGNGNIYAAWNPNATSLPGAIFNRSFDRGLSFTTPIALPVQAWAGTLTVNVDGKLYIAGVNNAGTSIYVIRSDNVNNPFQVPVFNTVLLDLGGTGLRGGGPNPVGLLGQIWIASDHSTGARRGNLYVLASVDPPGLDPLDVMFIRSTDGGVHWSAPRRINDDPTDNGAWQWFGTMSVAPNGRIDAIWNDTRNDPQATFSELFYSSSLDGGITWSPNTPLTPPFNHTLGYPMQDKLGDYYDMVSDTFGVSIAYAATFNGEQDIYFLRVGDFDCNNNGIPDVQDIANGTSEDCNFNSVPDECDADCNDNGLVDECETLAGVTPDCDNNLMPDECQPDFDLDTIPDVCDTDIDNDGVPNNLDTCDFSPPGSVVASDGRPMGDLSGDCRVQLDDYHRASRGNCLIGGPGVLLPSLCIDLMDFDRDGDIDLRDYGGFHRAFGQP